MGWVSIAFIGIGALVVLFGVFGLYSAIHILTRTRKVLGKVLGYEAIEEPFPSSRAGSRIRKKVTHYHPVLEFPDTHGKQQRVRSPVWTGRVIHLEGASVLVRFYPDDPQKAAIAESLGRMFGVPLSTMLVGAALAFAFYVFALP